MLQLIETSPSKKQEQFLNLIAGESPAWEETLRKKILTIERVYSWDGQYLAEIFSRLQPLTLATALNGNDEQQIQELLNCLPPISKRRITDLIAESSPTAAEKMTCIMKILTEVRGFIQQGIIKLEKVDPELHIEENIEELLAVSLVHVASGDSPGANGSGPSGADTNLSNQQDVEFLRRKCNQLMSEVNALKHENSVLKDRLDQIKRIA